MKENNVADSFLKKGRVESIDVFRGLTIFVMIFVNDVASVKGIPGWLKHMPSDLDGMTFVDLVFPAFLFIVGMAIPFAINKRISKGDNLIAVTRHILVRTAGLLTLGLFMVNYSSLSYDAAGISRDLWYLIVFTGAILVWNYYPSNEKKSIFLSMRITGIIILIVMAILYRRVDGDSILWMQTSWWGILGLIGWAYLGASFVYLIFRYNVPALAGMLAIFFLLYIGDKEGQLDFIPFIREHLWIGGHFAGHVAISLAGVITSVFMIDNSYAKTSKDKIKWILSFALILYLCGYLIRPFYGISKDFATPAWGLYSSAMSAVLFIILYWIVDLKGFNKWAGFLKPAGSNPLLAYILPSIFYSFLFLFNITFLAEYFGEGLPGILRSIVFSFLMLGITALLTRINIKLQL